MHPMNTEGEVEWKQSKTKNKNKESRIGVGGSLCACALCFGVSGRTFVGENVNVS